jgi:hypothetical protein
MLFNAVNGNGNLRITIFAPFRSAVGAHLVATSLTDAVSICPREAVTPNPRQAAVVSLVGRGMTKHAAEH